jgi:hypothetical protein
VDALSVTTNFTSLEFCSKSFWIFHQNYFSFSLFFFIIKTSKTKSFEYNIVLFVPSISSPYPSRWKKAFFLVLKKFTIKKFLSSTQKKKKMKSVSDDKLMKLMTMLNSQKKVSLRIPQHSSFFILLVGFKRNRRNFWRSKITAWERKQKKKGFASSEKDSCFG